MALTGTDLLRQATGGNTFNKGRVSSPKTGYFNTNVASKDYLRLNGAPVYSAPTNNNSGSGGTGVQQATAAPTGGGDGGGQSAPQGPSEMDIINEEFNSLNDFYGQEEGRATSQANTAKATLDAEGAVAQQTLKDQEALRVQELDARRTQTGMDAQGALTRIKQNLNDLSNKGAAYLSSVGGFGSSLGQAVAEKVGRVGASEVGRLENSTNQSYEAIRQEGAKVSQFFNEKVTGLQQQLLRGKQEIELQLQTRLSQIGQARSESRAAKAQQTMQAWRDYTNRVAQLRQSVFSTQQQLMAWALQKTESLKEAQAFALGATPNVDPSSFGIVAPNMPSTIGQPIGFNQMPNGVRVNLNRADTSTTDDDDETTSIFPSTVAS